MGRTETKKHEERGRAKAKIHNRGIRRNWMAGAILALIIAGGIAARQWPGMVWGYKRAPSFTLQSSTGGAVSLEDFRGKREVVLVFYMGAG